MRRRFQQMWDWIYKDAYQWRPGYWGKIPYLLVLRCLVAGGVWLRFKLHSEYPLPYWTYIAMVSAVGIAVALYWRPREKYSRLMYGALVAADIVVISAGYWSTNNVKSDFYLFYYLPLLTAAEFLSSRWTVAAFLGSTAAFGAVVFYMPPGPEYLGVPSFQLFARVFLPREVFYVAITLVWALRLRRERDSRQRSIARQRQMQQLLDCKRQLDQTFDIGEALQLLVEHARDDLHAQFSAGLLRPAPNHRDQDSLVRWSGGPLSDPETIDLCERALGAENPKGSVVIVALGTWIGAIAVRGLEARERANSEEYLLSLAELAAVAYERARLFEALREIGAAATVAVELNQKLEAILDELVDSLGFEYAIVSLVDTYRDEIRTIRGRNVPPGWIASSAHSLQSGDILADVVNSGRTEISDCYDPRFNFQIWDRYNHERLARVFVPIVAGEGASGRVVGVVEAGCAKERREAILDPNVTRVERLGRESGEQILRSLPNTVLEFIAARSMDLIGADAASLHVFEGEREFLVAGAGKADKAFLRQHTPSPNGIGQTAMATGRRVVRNQLLESQRALIDAGVHALAAFPLKLGGNMRGVLYMHYCREQRFQDATLELVSVFVPQMEVAIQNSLLLQDFSKIDEKAWMVTALHNVIRSLSSDLDLDHLLGRLAGDALYMMDAKNVTLYQYTQEERKFSRAVTAGRFEKRDEMTNQVFEDDIVTKAVAEGRSRFISNAASDPFLKQPRKDKIPRPRFAERENIKSCAILVLKSLYDGEIVGCLFANYDKPQAFESAGKKWLVSLANSLASSAAVAIKTARLHAQDIGRNQAWLKRRERELHALRAIDRAIVASVEGPDIAKLCETVLDEALTVIGPHGDVTLGDVSLWDDLLKHLKVVAVRGNPGSSLNSTTPPGVGIVGWVAQERKPALVHDVTQDSRYHKTNPDTRSELAVPMVDMAHGEERLLGVINVEHRNVNAFSDSDRTFLETLAVQATLALHTVELYGKLQGQIRQALSLGNIAAHIQESSLARDTILRLIMTGVTSSEGLGFSRAILLEVDEHSRALRGSLGIGAMTRSKAEVNWGRIKNASLDMLMEWVEKGSGPSQGADDELNRWTREIRIPLGSLKGPLRDCLSASVVRVLPMRGADFVGGALESLYHGAPHCAVACVPLRAAEKMIGLLLVDNRFLFGEQDMDPASAPILVAFGELAAMSIEGGRLRERLADESQLANWRKASGRVAHVLKSRVFNIEGLARDAAACLGRHEVSNARVRLDKLANDLVEFANVFEKIQRFSSEKKPSLAVWDLVAVIRQTVDNCRRNLACRIEPILDPGPVYVDADRELLPDVFIDILYNADRAMKEANTPDPCIRIALLRDPAEGNVSVEIEDNGPGVPDDLRESLFEPYITKFEPYIINPHRTGLGLAIIKDLVEQHNGTIVYHPQGSGARFVVRFPVVAAMGAVAASLRES